MTRMTLFIAGECERSASARTAVLQLCERAAIEAEHVEIIDVDLSPQMAEEAGVLAVPTVIAEDRGATRRVIGSLADVERLASALDIDLLPHIAA